MRICSLLLIVLFISSCERRERVLGVIEFYGDGVRPVLPDTVSRGETFAASITTYHSACTDPGPTAVRRDGLRAEFIPYDHERRDRTGSTDCNLALVSTEHEAALWFDEVGMATVTFHGRSEPSGKRIAVERRVQVR